MHLKGFGFSLVDDLRARLREPLLPAYRRDHADLTYCCRVLDQKMESLPFTLIHDDLLPLNVIVQDKRAVIIDWEHGRQDFYALDIGRMLGDLKNEKGEGWINRDWIDPVLNRYYQSLKAVIAEQCPSREELTAHFKLARWLNCFGIVEAHLRRGFDRSGWYDVNLAFIKDHLSEIVQQDLLRNPSI